MLNDKSPLLCCLGVVEAFDRLLHGVVKCFTRKNNVAELLIRAVL